MTAGHLVHSHAHESELPGTVDLRTTEGDDTGYGQALFPVPADDPNDPLQWGQGKKTGILVICALYSFLGNATLVGPSVYIGLFAQEFRITPNVASGLISYANLVYGFGSLVLVPAYLKFGRRPVMLGSLVLYIVGLIGCSQSTSYGMLMTFRIIAAFGSGICESLPVQLVNDIFFLHERGKRLGFYTVCLCWGSTGPLYAGYMLGAGLGWQLFFYVLIAFAGVLFIAAFFVCEETAYKRTIVPPSPTGSAVALDKDSTSAEALEKAPHETAVETMVPPRYSFMAQLKVWNGVNHEAEFFMTMARSFTYFLVPAVFWVIASFGIYIGLGALAFNYTFPIKIVAPPYNWKVTNSGLIALGNIIGFALALPFTTSSDRLAARLTKKNGGIREAEMRLGVILPAMVIGPAGLLLYGYAAQRNLPWISYFVAVAMVSWASYFYFTFALAYAIDSQTANTSEMLIAMNLGKQAISFGMGIYLLQWILNLGYVTVISGIFVAVLVANNFSLLIFMFKGKAIRRAMHNSWLAKIHGRNATVGEVA